ncbi:MAG TPA: hypothetical protein VN538_05035 [Clostridia bacterium]|nr:hypothetical protein [Clostridia bacterium]
MKEFLERVIAIIESFSPYVSLSLYVIAVGSIFFGDKLKRFFRNRELSRLLSINKKKEIEVFIPVRNGKLTNVINEYGNTFDMSNSYNYAKFEEVSAIIEITAILKSLEINVNICSYYDLKQGKYGNDKFLLGKNSSNGYTFNCFSTYFPDIKFGSTSESYNRIGNAHLRNIKVVNDNNPRIIYYPNGEFHYDLDYVALVKLGRKFWDDEEHGVVHMCFGDLENSSYQALRSYSEHIHKLYKILKKHHDSYFLIINVRQNNEPDFSEYIDLTHVLFNPDGSLRKKPAN